GFDGAVRTMSGQCPYRLLLKGLDGAVRPMSEHVPYRLLLKGLDGAVRLTVLDGAVRTMSGHCPDGHLLKGLDGAVSQNGGSLDRPRADQAEDRAVGSRGQLGEHVAAE